MYTIIKSFYQVELEEKCLLVLDIDETVLKYKDINRKWWDNKLAYYYNIYNDYRIADSHAFEDWKAYIHDNLPEHTDEDGIFDLIDRAEKLNCDIIFLTARSYYLDKITEAHLSHLGIHEQIVHYATGKNKGILLNEIIKNDYDHHKTIIFIDDMDKNLNAVKTEIDDKHVICLKFVIEGHESGYPSINFGDDE